MRNQIRPAYLNCANCVSSHWTRNNSTLYLSDLQRESSTADPTADVPAADNLNSQGNSKFYETPIIKILGSGRMILRARGGKPHAHSRMTSNLKLSAELHDQLF